MWTIKYCDMWYILLNSQVVVILDLIIIMSFMTIDKIYVCENFLELSQ